METSSVTTNNRGSSSKKFHTQCLSCATCRSVLKEDYFEFNGRVYCERDAFRLASLPGRAGYDSAPARPSPLVRELVTNSGGSGIRGGSDANAVQQSNEGEEETRRDSTTFRHGSNCESNSDSSKHALVKCE